MSVIIGHASINEFGKVVGGRPGDQTGKEVCTRSWYKKPWDFILRAYDIDIRNRLVDLCENACANDHIGYAQDRRNSLHTLARKFGYNLHNVDEDCDVDCSSFMTICAIGAGVKELEYTTNAPTTSTMGNVFVKTKKFEKLTDSVYRNSDELLLYGDILVKAGSHTVMALQSGDCKKLIKRGNKSIYTVEIQKGINAFHRLELNNELLKVDGDFGPATETAVKLFQNYFDLEVDGVVGQNTWKKLMPFREKGTS